MMEINETEVAIFSDLHLGVHSNSTKWHDITLEWALWICGELKDKKIKTIFFLGDWFDNRSEISVNTLSVSSKVLDIFKDFNIIMITGNHDQFYRYRTDVHSLSILRGQKNITVFDEPAYVSVNNRKFVFIPWGHNINEIEPGDCCFGHLEVELFNMNNSTVCEHGIKISELLNKYTLSFSGHFHTRSEKTFKEGKIIYVGNPFSTSFNDINNQKGYYILNTDTLEYSFFGNSISPKYHRITLSDIIKQEGITQDLKSLFCYNFLNIKIDKNVSSDDMHVLQTVFAQLKAEQIVYDYDLAYNKIQNDTQDIDFSGVDIPDAFNQFIQMLDIDDKKGMTDFMIDLYKKHKK
jgi:DNA repair exonuclease SbcCD nuclease subunit